MGAWLWEWFPSSPVTPRESFIYNGLYPT